MTPQEAEKIYNEVIEEKEKVSVVDISDRKEGLHNGITKNVADFLKQYEKDPKGCLDEFKKLNDKAQQILKEVKFG